MKNPALFLALPLVEKIFNVLLIGILKGMGQPHRHSNCRAYGKMGLVCRNGHVYT